MTSRLKDFNLQEVDLTEQDRVWNRAAMDDGGEEPRAGDRALADLLYAHGMVMNGGVHHALEVLTPDELKAAIAGFRYFSLGAVADLLEEGLTDETFGGDSGDAEGRANRRYWALIPDDEAIVVRFEAVYASSPAEFAPLAQAHV